MAMRTIVFPIIFFLLCPMFGRAQGFSEEMIKACQKFLDAEQVYMDVEVAIFPSHTTSTPTSSYKGKVVRGRGYYFVENGMLTICQQGKNMVLINNLEKTVSYRQVDDKESNALFKGLEDFDLAKSIKQMDSLVNKTGKVFALPAEKNQTIYRIDFTEGLYKSVTVVFQNGFINSMTYLYDSKLMGTNNKIAVSYKNVSFENGQAILPFSPEDVVSIPGKGKIQLSPKYSKYELIIVKDGMQ